MASDNGRSRTVDNHLLLTAEPPTGRLRLSPRSSFARDLRSQPTLSGILCQARAMPHKEDKVRLRPNPPGAKPLDLKLLGFLFEISLPC